MKLLQATIFASILRTSIANLLDPLLPNASEGALKWQPVLDFDKDVCYHVAAVDGSFRLNEGLEPSSSTRECRAQDRLYHSNAYVRQRCNHYWCAYMYAYYSEFDYSAFSSHRHDWEHAIVWTLHDQVVFVSWSHHGDWSTAHHTQVRFEGTHAKLVSHKGFANTGSLRLAKAEDDNIESHWRNWFQAYVLSWENNPGLLGRIAQHNWGSAHFELKDGDFGQALKDAMPRDAEVNEGFDPWSG